MVWESQKTAIYLTSVTLVTRARNPFLDVPEHPVFMDEEIEAASRREATAFPAPVLSFPSPDLVVSFPSSLRRGQTHLTNGIQELSFACWKLLVLFWEGLIFIADLKNQNVVKYKILIPRGDAWQT